MDESLRQLIRRRASERCEYCHLPQAIHDERFSIDHVIPRKHGGDNSERNLALCCLRCNLYKGTNLSGIDPVDGNVVRLFDPRREIWLDHFRWTGPLLAGLTATGRTTITVLRMNAAERVRLRQVLFSEGSMPLD